MPPRTINGNRHRLYVAGSPVYVMRFQRLRGSCTGKKAWIWSVELTGNACRKVSTQADASLEEFKKQHGYDRLGWDSGIVERGTSHRTGEF